MKSLTGIFRSSATLLLLMLVLLGGVYPLVVTAIAQLVFPHKADGSLIERDGKVVGSELLGQQFENEWYFWGRDSATRPDLPGHVSGGSNLGPTNNKMLTRVLERARKMQAYGHGPVPADLVTSSASGLDPDISVEAARYQLSRVAAARHIGEKRLERLIEDHTQSFGFGLLAEPYVNVLELNMALDELARQPGKK